MAAESIATMLKAPFIVRFALRRRRECSIGRTRQLVEAPCSICRLCQGRKCLQLSIYLAGKCELQLGAGCPGGALESAAGQPQRRGVGARLEHGGGERPWAAQPAASRLGAPDGGVVRGSEGRACGAAVLEASWRRGRAGSGMERCCRLPASSAPSGGRRCSLGRPRAVGGLPPPNPPWAARERRKESPNVCERGGAQGGGRFHFGQL